MAVVSQHAMRRHPGGPLDPSITNANNTNGSNYFALQSVPFSAEKSKKTWGQRLKITKSDKLLPPFTNNDLPPLESSALSRSMKYAEPWLYGTVRGVQMAQLPYQMPGVQPVFNGATEIAVIICSCSEYLSGTKRDVKKATVCKKCRGSRLPLAPIGGTVRIHSTTPLAHTVHRISAGTVRLPSTNNGKQRPTILEAPKDPYDLMRRSRLLSPDLQPVKASTKNRAKSTSPSRSRSRSRKTGIQSVKTSDTWRDISRNRSSSRTRTKSPEPTASGWLSDYDDYVSETSTRRSILNCDINAYELISNMSHNNEFSPPHNENDSYNIQESVINSKGVTSLAGQQIQVISGIGIGSKFTDIGNFENYEKVDVSSQNVNLIHEGKAVPSYKRNVINFNTCIESECRTQNDTLINTNNIIKSILKRPPSISSESEVEPYTYVKFNNQAVAMPGVLIQKMVPTNNEDNAKGTAPTISMNKSDKTDTTPHQQQIFVQEDQTNYDDGTATKQRNTFLSSNNFTDNKTLGDLDAHDKHNNPTGSNLYQPMPVHRKKVQFLVENEIIHNLPSSKLNPAQQNNSTDSNQNTPGKCLIDNDGNIIVRPNIELPTLITVQSTKKLSIESLPGKEMTSDLSMMHSDPVLHCEKQNEQTIHHDSFSFGCQSRLDIIECIPNADSKSINGENSSSSPQKEVKIRRSFSDRCLQSPAATDENILSMSTNYHPSAISIHFQDTTALRQRPIRIDSRDVFSDDESIIRHAVRPRDPPPPPPYVIASSNSGSESNESERMRPRRPQRKQGRRPNKINTNTVLPSEKNEAIIQSDYEQRKRILANIEAFHGSRIFGKTPNELDTDRLTKTIVRVSPLVINRESVHRLEIRNEPEYTASATNDQRKTSIMINGNDCYSTINVNNDNSPIYQSSVVVNDNDESILKANSNAVTIINVRTPPIDNQPIIDDRVEIIPTVHHQTKTLITLDGSSVTTNRRLSTDPPLTDPINEEDFMRYLRNPVEAVKRNLVPHVCGRTELHETDRNRSIPQSKVDMLSPKLSIAENENVIDRLLEDPTLGHLAEGLDSELIAKLIENSLKRLKESRVAVNANCTKDDKDMNRLIDISLQKVKEERLKLSLYNYKVAIPTSDTLINVKPSEEPDKLSNRDSMSSGNSYSSANYELFDFETNDMSDCYQSCSSELTADEDGNVTRSRFYQMLVDATLSEIEITTSIDDDHHYESIRLHGDPIYEEINDIPPPLPLSSPPSDIDVDKKYSSKSMFEGASKYDILSYLVDAKERGLVHDDSFTYNINNISGIIIEEEQSGTKNDSTNQPNHELNSRNSQVSMISIQSDESASSSTTKFVVQRKSSAEIERNDSGVGSETSKSSRSKYQNVAGSILYKNSPIHLCEDCDGPVETQITNSGVIFAPLVCRKCSKKRAERKEIVTEIVETEEKYSRDLQIILEEFYQPMLVAGLLTQEQLSAIFLNTEELLENSQCLADRMRDAYDIALEQGDDDLLTVNIGKIILDAATMLHAFENYCIRQAAASLLLASMEKDKELLRIFLRVSQMENTVLRRMNLNSFLMVPVQRVTKYPLLLARLYKVTPNHLEGRELLKQAQEKIELHLNHMNREAKDVPTKLWRRISSSSPNRRSTCEIDMINIKLRKMAIDLLEWNHDEVRFAIEGKLLFTQPTDNNWRKGRTIKLTPVNALLVTNGKPTASYKVEKALGEPVNFPHHTGIREATLLLVREKSGRYTLLREPLFLDRCVVCTEIDWNDYFEVQEISSKDTFIFKSEDGSRTKHWYAQLQYHSQGMGAWRKRRNALANIMINGMMMRT